MMHCDTDLLWSLVQQHDEPGENLDAIARHLETCPRCRETLADLGGSPDWWEDARRCLSDHEDEAACLDEQPARAVDLSFLDPPIHPEMLGRLDRYDVEGLVGRGGMGVVLRGYDSDLHRSVAIKVMAPEWAASMPARRRFAREAQAAASVAHENVVPIYNVGADAKQPFLVMQYIPGMTLQSWVRTHGPLDSATILRVAGQLAEGLSAAHRRGLVHRDVKPGNVLVGENIDRVWITDFGLARAADSITLTRTGVIAGTPHYMSPEQARGEPIDQRSDLFSLGCVLYFLATGEPPFDAENTLAVLHRLVTDKPLRLSEHRDDLPPSFVSLVDQLLRRSPTKRPANCQAVIAQLAIAQDELNQGKTAKPPLSLPARIVIGLSAASLLLATGMLLLPHRMQGKTNPPLLTLRQENDSLSTSDNTAHQPVSPYIRRAAETIESAGQIDQHRFQQQLYQIETDLQRLRRYDEPLVFSMTQDDDLAWQEQVDLIQSAINELRY